MVKHPWDDHPHDHTVLNTVLACVAVAVGVAGMLNLKHERKDSIIGDGSCYVWSDGHKTCKPAMTEAERHYGCRFIDADAHGGECP